MGRWLSLRRAEPGAPLSTARPGIDRICGLLLLAALGCGGPRAESTAQDFWSALQGGDRQAALALSTGTDPSELDTLLEGRVASAARFEAALENQERARVPTQFEIEGLDSPVSFDTHLARASGGWRVDVVSTRRALRAAEVAALLESAAGVVREGALKLSEAFEEGAREAARGIDQFLREMERDLGEELRDFEVEPQPDSQSGPGSPPEPQPPAEPGSQPESPSPRTTGSG